VVTSLGLLLKADEMRLPHGLSTGKPTYNLEVFDDRHTDDCATATYFLV
jgi:hypothetical protein